MSVPNNAPAAPAPIPAPGGGDVLGRGEEEPREHPAFALWREIYEEDSPSGEKGRMIGFQRQGVAAKVEDKVITYHDLRERIGPRLAELRAESNSQRQFRQEMVDLYKNVIDQLVNNVLIVKEFHNREYKLPASAVEKEYERVLAKEYGNDRVRFLEHLRSIGSNHREFREELKESIIISIMYGQMARSRAEVSPEKIRDFYNKNKISFYQEETVHLRKIILEPLADESPDMLDQVAQKLVSELDGGADFDQVAEKYTKLGRGSVDEPRWFERGELNLPLREAAFALPLGRHSKPIRIERLIFVIKVDDRRDEGFRPLSEVREKIEDILLRQIRLQAQEAWLFRLREGAYIRRYDL